MRHAELIAELERRLGGRRAAVSALDAFVEAIMAEVASGGRVTLTGFGVFEAAHDRSGLPVPRFRPGSGFKDLVARPRGIPPVNVAIGNPKPLAPGKVDGADGVTTRSVVSRSRRVERASGGRLHFRHYPLAAAVSLSAVLSAESPRCGIYVLHFDDGQRYVGQARDVLTRFADHRRHWGDRIVGIDFAPAGPDQLDDLERRTIQSHERQEIGLYNSALVGMPMGEGPLDLVVDRVEQERWLDGAAEAEYDLSERLSLAASRPRSGAKFWELASREDYQSIRAALFVYLTEVVPWPHEAERRFWSVTSMPSTGRSRDQHRLIAISVNNVETLVIGEVLDEEGWRVRGFINVAPGLADLGDWPFVRASYRTVGEVDRIHFAGLDGLMDLLEKPDVLDAARRTALGLMRKGRGMMAKYHDDSLADDVFAVVTELGGDDYAPG